MKDVFENVMKDLDDFPSNNFTTFKPFEKILNEIEVSNLSIADLKQSDFKGEWMYVSKLLVMQAKMVQDIIDVATQAPKCKSGGSRASKDH